MTVIKVADLLYAAKCKAAVLRDHGKGRRDRHRQNILYECPLTSRPWAGSCDVNPINVDDRIDRGPPGPGALSVPCDSGPRPARRLQPAGGRRGLSTVEAASEARPGLPTAPASLGRLSTPNSCHDLQAPHILKQDRRWEHAPRRRWEHAPRR